MVSAFEGNNKTGVFDLVTKSILLKRIFIILSSAWLFFVSSFES